MNTIRSFLANVRKDFYEYVRAAAPTSCVGERRALSIFTKTVADGRKLRVQGRETFLKGQTNYTSPLAA